MWRPLFVVLLLAGAGSCRSQEKPRPLTLRLASAEKIVTLDPARVDDVYSAREASRTYESLLEYHYLKRPYELIPSLAASLPRVSPDGKTYVLRLKRGVYFHDDPCFQDRRGRARELTADDVVYSFKRLADPRIDSPFWKSLDGRIAGLNAWRSQAAKRGVADYSLPVAGLVAKSSDVLEIKLTSPFRRFSYLLATPSMAVVAKEAVDFYGSRFGRRAVGTGPFRLQAEQSDLSSRLDWVRNPRFREDVYPSEGEAADESEGLLVDRGKKLPRVDRIELRVMPDRDRQWLGFEKGELDVADLPNTLPAGVLTPTKELAQAWKEKSVVLRKGVGLDISYVAFNLTTAPFKGNSLLRQALSLAVDTDPLIDRVYGGRAIPAVSPIPPGLPDYLPALANPYRRHDLARAKDLLARAGFPGGQGLPSLEYLAYRQAGTADPLASYLKQSFQQIGVDLKVTEVDWAEFGAAVRKRRGQLWSLSWSFAYPDARGVLELFYSKGIARGSNESGYSSSAYDALFEKLERASNENEAGKISQEMVKILIEDCPWIWLVHQLHFRVAGPRVGNFKLSEFDFGAAKYLSVRN